MICSWTKNKIVLEFPISKNPFEQKNPTYATHEVDLGHAWPELIQHHWNRVFLNSLQLSPRIGQLDWMSLYGLWKNKIYLEVFLQASIKSKAVEAQYNSCSWLKTAASNWLLHGLVIEKSNFHQNNQQKTQFFVTLRSLDHVEDKWKKIIQFEKKSWTNMTFH